MSGRMFDHLSDEEREQVARGLEFFIPAPDEQHPLDVCDELNQLADKSEKGEQLNGESYKKD